VDISNKVAMTKVAMTKVDISNSLQVMITTESMRMEPNGGRMIMESGGTKLLVMPIGVNGEIEDGE
jgi:hypothetical protein